MRRYDALCAAAAIVLAASMAEAQTAFIEGHVFNKYTGIPLSGAVVRVFENVTAGPLPVELAAGVTDDNGFYQFEVEEFLGFQAIIEVVCATPTTEIRGGSSARLREGLIRRDVYLPARWRVSACQPTRLE